ncbi:hypothetical protein BV25DRAFT_1995624 [Artomyces pyxidatus]|uniref:Uncharacterized protein n=1 Tax=Artomyces pyxidatus TaxID=48021 RepID=A0ACB8SIW4_9AGAM|nr:hypothetical protein BV25DRAFT_1995624 [Artomyces pyxidatus]
MQSYPIPDIYATAGTSDTPLRDVFSHSAFSKTKRTSTSRAIFLLGALSVLSKLSRVQFTRNKTRKAPSPPPTSSDADVNARVLPSNTPSATPEAAPSPRASIDSTDTLVSTSSADSSPDMDNFSMLNDFDWSATLYSATTLELVPSPEVDESVPSELAPPRPSRRYGCACRVCAIRIDEGVHRNWHAPRYPRKGLRASSPLATIKSSSSDESDDEEPDTTSQQDREFFDSMLAQFEAQL